MDRINVSIESETEFVVTVQGRPTTTHRVTLSRADFQRLTKGLVAREAFVKMAFEFLLEREPNTSILAEFDLPMIEQYFPGFEEEITERVEALGP